MINHEPMTIEQALRFATASAFRRVYIVCPTFDSKRDLLRFVREYIERHQIAAFRRGSAVVCTATRSTLRFKHATGGVRELAGEQAPDLVLFSDCYPVGDFADELKRRCLTKPNAMFAALGWSS